jgi:hypothetical protein
VPGIGNYLLLGNSATFQVENGVLGAVPEMLAYPLSLTGNGHLRQVQFTPQLISVLPSAALPFRRPALPPTSYPKLRAYVNKMPPNT